MNFFNIIHLSSISPKLGFLPAVQSRDKTESTPSLSNNLKYAKQNLDKPTFNSTINQYILTGLIEGYGKNSISVYTTEGKQTFTVDNSTIIQKLIADRFSSAQSGTLESSQNYKFSEFVGQVSTGSFLQIFYTKDSNSQKAAKIFYFPDYKFK